MKISFGGDAAFLEVFVVGDEVSSLIVSPAPIVKNRNLHQGRNGMRVPHWNTMTTDEKKILQELAGLDQKLETRSTVEGIMNGSYMDLKAWCAQDGSVDLR